MFCMNATRWNPDQKGTSSTELVHNMACPCRHPCHSVMTMSPLLRYGELVRFKRGQVLWRRGQPAESFVGVCTGRLKLSWSRPNGSELVLTMVGRGALVGEETALPGQRHFSDCVVLNDGKGIFMDHRLLRLAIDEDPEMGNVLLGASCSRSVLVEHRFEEMGGGTVQYRVARLMYRIALESGLRDARGVFVPVPMKRREVGAMVGCRTETVIRLFTKWKKMGLIEHIREGFVVGDMVALARLSRMPMGKGAS